MRSLSEHLSAPAIDGTVVAEPSTEGCAGGSCGVIVRFFLTVTDGVITDINAKVRGSSVAFAAASAIAESAQGRDIVSAATIGMLTLHNDFQQLDDAAVEQVLVVEDAFHHALGKWLITAARDEVRLPKSRDEIVAMSGGVDSAVALHDRIEAGEKVVGATLRLWIDPKAPDPEAACCAPNSVRRARATCHAVGVPHFSLDLRDSFVKNVVAPFIEDYKSGKTPNPCVRCNGTFRLHELVMVADVLGTPTIVTGHYVRTATIGGRKLVQRGVDPTKDQSYMLASLPTEIVERFVFPLGGSVKTDTRKRAHELKLEQATAAESQEICFLGGGDYRSFLTRMDGLGPSGDIVDNDGNVLGKHDGLARFTPGQRRGIGVNNVGQSTATTGPLYVIATDSQSGNVTVGPRESLRRKQVRLTEARSHGNRVDSALVRLRYRSEPASARVTWLENNCAELEFDEAVLAPAPGQTACMYDDNGVVIGFGMIAR